MKNRFLASFVFVYLVTSLVFSHSVYAQQGSFNLSKLPTLSNPPKERSVRSFGSTEPPSASDSSDDISSFGIATVPTTPAGLPIFYTVHVLGEVSRPGTYKIAPSDRLTDALKRAGDALPNGSERAIQLKRTGQTETIDLYAYRYKGSLDENPYLMENDVIFVPVRKGEIQIEGPVNRPGYYELTKSITLADAIKMAGGFSAGVSQKEPIRVVRYNGDEKKEVIEIENSPNDSSHFTIKSGDAIVVPHVLIADKEFDYNLKRIPGDNLFYPTIDDNVYVMGAVLQPGAYPFEPNFTYKEYVSLAGATDRSKIKNVKILHRNGEKIKATDKVVINPGDTIVVPQKYWRAETVASWLSTAASLTLSTLVISDRVNN